MEEALHLEGVLRFIAVFFVTVGVPSLLLAYFGVASIRTEERSVGGEVEGDAVALADSFWSQSDRRFSGFESRVLDRLEAGRSPLESPGELHTLLLTAMRLSEDGVLLAPFVEEDGGATAPIEELFDPHWRAVWERERAGAPPAELAEAYFQAAALTGSRAVEGRARFDAARQLNRSGQQRRAEDLLVDIEAHFGGLRDPWGIRLADLARLEQATFALARDPGSGEAALRDLVEDLLAARWVVGEGGEAAVARRALSLLEPYGRREWGAGARGRVAERTAMLYWTGVLLPELRQFQIGGGSLRMGSGALRWQVGERGVWATTWWGDELYAFALDQDALLAELKADARGLATPDSGLSAYLAGPLDPVQSRALVQRSLAPWLPGWQLVVEHRDPEALARLRARKRNQRLGVVGLSTLLLVIGGVMSARLVKRELDVAGMQTRFAANVSHELRSPITQIRLKGEALMLGLADSEEEQQEAYHAIVRESERLSRLVDNVLDFAAIERGKKSYVLKPGDLADSVLRAIDSLSSSIELSDKELDVELPHDLPEVSFDSDAVAQCVINVVSNAAKYSDPGGWIGVRARVVAGFVEIAISDRGIGIPPHDLRHLFEPYYRSADSLARRRKGTGIGLTITRYIMRAHGGDVSVSSRPGKGSTFTLRFPLRAPDPSPTSPSSRDRSPSRATGA